MPSMITELEVVPHQIEPARKIQVQEYKCNNFHLHSCLTQLARIMLGQIENQTNNMTGEVVPRDASALQTGWAAYKATLQFALDHNDPPSGSHEYGYVVLLPTQDEIMKMPNTKAKMVVQHLDRLCQVIMSSDSANSNGNIGTQSEADISEQTAICEDAIALWLGTGATNGDVGMQIPIFKHLGEIRPDVDYDKGMVREPTADRAHSGRPDVADRVLGD